MLAPLSLLFGVLVPRFEPWDYDLAVPLHFDVVFCAVDIASIASVLRWVRSVVLLAQ